MKIINLFVTFLFILTSRDTLSQDCEPKECFKYLDEIISKNPPPPSSFKIPDPKHTKFNQFNDLISRFHNLVNLINEVKKIQVILNPEEEKAHAIKKLQEVVGEIDEIEYNNSKQICTSAENKMKLLEDSVQELKELEKELDSSKSDFNESKLKKVYKDSQTNHELVRHLISTILNTSCENLAISLDSLLKVIEFNKNVLMKLFEELCKKMNMLFDIDEIKKLSKEYFSEIPPPFYSFEDKLAPTVEEYVNKIKLLDTTLLDQIQKEIDEKTLKLDEMEKFLKEITDQIPGVRRTIETHVKNLENLQYSFQTMLDEYQILVKRSESLPKTEAECPRATLEE